MLMEEEVEWMLIEEEGDVDRGGGVDRGVREDVVREVGGEDVFRGVGRGDVVRGVGRGDVDRGGGRGL